MGRLTRKAAIIPGGEGSLGRAAGLALVAEGANVGRAGLFGPGLTAVSAELGRRGPGRRGGAASD